MTGTEKQIAYATTIKNAFLHNADQIVGAETAKADRNVPQQAAFVAKVEATVAALKANENATFWINNRSEFEVSSLWRCLVMRSMK
jgi:hypothetical protein